MYHENVYNVTQSPLYPPHCHYTMELTVVNDLGQTFVIEVDPNMELENVMALLEAEVRQISTWPVSVVDLHSLASPLQNKVFITMERS